MKLELTDAASESPFRISDTDDLACPTPVFREAPSAGIFLLFLLLGLHVIFLAEEILFLKMQGKCIEIVYGLDI